MLGHFARIIHSKGNKYQSHIALVSVVSAVAFPEPAALPANCSDISSLSSLSADKIRGNSLPNCEAKYALKPIHGFDAAGFSHHFHFPSPHPVRQPLGI